VGKHDAGYAVTLKDTPAFGKGPGHDPLEKRAVLGLPLELARFILNNFMELR
jgi:hypothetical protein